MPLRTREVGLWAKQHRMPTTLHTIAWAQARTISGSGSSPSSELFLEEVMSGQRILLRTFLISKELMGGKVRSGVYLVSLKTHKCLKCVGTTLATTTGKDQ